MAFTRRGWGHLPLRAPGGAGKGALRAPQVVLRPSCEIPEESVNRKRKINNKMIGGADYAGLANDFS